MESLDALKRRTATTEELSSLVGTMKALSAVNIRQYERAVASVRDYYRTVEDGLRILLRDRRYEPPLRHAAPPGAAALVLGSDYGLCGQFNDEVAGFARDRLASAAGDGRRRVAAVGARVAARLTDLGLEPDEVLAAPSSVSGIEASVRSLLVTVDRWHAEGEVGRVLLVHHRHGAPAEARLRAEQILPLEWSRFRRLAGEPWPSRCLPTFRLAPEPLASALLRHYLFVAVFRAVAESAAAEHASRLETMQSAERNLEERLDELRREFRRRRQDAITAELLDVVAGFEALTRR